MLDGEQAQFQTALQRGRARYSVPDVDPYYQRAAGFVQSDQRWLSQHFAAAATPAARDDVLAEGARRAIVAYSTMGAGDAPDWLYSVGGIARSLGVAPVPAVPTMGPAAGSSNSSSYSLSPSLSPSLALNVPGLPLVLLLLLLVVASDDKDKTEEY